MKINKFEIDDVIVTEMVYENGEIDKLEFRPKEGGRTRYLLNGKPVTGVTTILNQKAKPQVTEWAIKLAYEDCLNRNNAQIEQIIEDKNWASKRKSGDAMDIGTKAHAWVEEYAKAHIKGLPVPQVPDQPELYKIIQPFVDWCNGRIGMRVKKNSYDKNSVAVSPLTPIKFIASEMSVVSKKYWYAGSFDLLIEMDGKKYMADFKTSSGIYGRGYFQQCAAYWNAWNEMGYDKDIAGCVVIRSGKNGNDLEVQASYTFDRDINGFLCCLGLYKDGELDFTPDFELLETLTVK